MDHDHDSTEEEGLFAHHRGGLVDGVAAEAREGESRFGNYSRNPRECSGVSTEPRAVREILMHRQYA